ncbi:MAG: gamma-glutamyltransferase [Bacteroidota bacterium]|nr:gamma-glutamyltransferase [Bacteroidota bacterium]
MLHAQTEGRKPPYPITKMIEARHGAVVSAHPLASRTGLAILKAGGNAVDAAIAMQLALAVVYPAAGNIGGGGFMVAHLAQGKNIAIDFREEAPGKASRDMYLDAEGNPQSELSLNGHLAAGVPGTVAGLFAELNYAKLPFTKLIQPAIDLAENGFILSGAEARSLNDAKDAFMKYNRVRPVFVREGGWKAGDTLVQKDLARTLRRIRDGGKKAFYGGLTARLIVAEMQRGNGIITADDLLRYKARERKPAVFGYKAYRILTMPLPGSGSVVLQQMMKMAERLPMHAYGFESIRSVHYMAEMERLAYADRARYLGDPDFFHVPLRALTEDAYLTQRLSLIDPARAGNSQDVQAGQVTEKSEETTHLDAYDAEGNAVSVTTTLNGGYGSKVVVAGAGFLLNNEMDDFSSKPGTPNMFGAIGAEANAIYPGKRMLSSMTPTIVLEKDKPFLIVGTPGGTTITTSVFQTLLDILEFGLDPKEAVDKPKFHHQWQPDSLYVEREFPEALRGPLRDMGYKLAERSAIGRTELIEIANGLIKAVGDHRGEDAAEGY